MLLPRENISLSSLDLSHPHGLFPASRFYESNIKILELEGRLGSNILLARSEASQVTYAIEREREGLYTLCKLGAWVDVTQLAQFATAVCGQRIRSLRQPQTISSESLTTTTSQSHHEYKKRRLAIEELQSVVRRRPRSQGSTTPAEQQSQSHTDVPAENNIGSKAVVGNEQSTPTAVEIPLPQAKNPAPGLGTQLERNEELPPPTAEDILRNIRTQYFDTLYHSMVSCDLCPVIIIRSFLTLPGFIGVLCQGPSLSGTGDIPLRL